MENCTGSDIELQSFALTIPDGLAVPAYAYLNVTATGTFDEAAARNLATESNPPPDSTAVNSPTDTSTSTAPSSKKSSHTGAIAGGVVGGVLGLVLIIFACLWFLRRRRLMQDKDQFSHAKLDMTAEPSSAGLSQSFTGYAPTISSHPPMKLYDPNDPSTFPGSPMSFPATTPPPPSISNSHGMHSHDASMSQYSVSHSRGMSDGGYKGIPEV